MLLVAAVRGVPLSADRGGGRSQGDILGDGTMLDPRGTSLTGCEKDSDCVAGSASWKCLPSSFSNTSCMDVHGLTTCACQPGDCNLGAWSHSQHTQKRDYDAEIPGRLQWLMIGDSIARKSSPFIDAGLKEDAEVQVVHIPINGGNVWQGVHCLESWLGSNPSRWNVVTFQFGLHDLAGSREHLTPAVYGPNLRAFANHLAQSAPNAALIWVTTTPVSTKCVKAADCDPPLQRETGDVRIYNEVAEQALTGTPNLRTLDMHAVVTTACGAAIYERCPESCSSDDDCYQEVGGVHFTEIGNPGIARAYIEEIYKTLNVGSSRSQQA